LSSRIRSIGADRKPLAIAIFRVRVGMAAERSREAVNQRTDSVFSNFEFGFRGAAR
jgi:hypothetical protein